MSRQRTFSDSIGSPKVVHFKMLTTQPYFLIDHVSGNLDVFLNGSLLLPEIGDSTGTNNNFSSLDYDYQSGTADNIAGVNWTAISSVDQSCTAIKLNFTPKINDIISLRSF
tara:strand:+ start:2328 stop:2660 length:333 start_codon:yes stop_codon:yes gene_type:complete